MTDYTRTTTDYWTHDGNGWTSGAFKIVKFIGDDGKIPPAQLGDCTKAYALIVRGKWSGSYDTLEEAKQSALAIHVVNVGNPF